MCHKELFVLREYMHLVDKKGNIMILIELAYWADSVLLLEELIHSFFNIPLIGHFYLI